MREEGKNPPDVAALEQRYAVTDFPTLVVASPDRPRFEKQAGFPGAPATRQFLSQATARVMRLAPRERVRARRDSAAAGMR